VSEFRQQSERRLAVYRELSEEASKVMTESVPTPTQAENDAMMMGQPRPDSAPAASPGMPPLHEQQARLEGTAPRAPSRATISHEPAAAAPAPHRK
jgi:hypothetical protein